LFNDDVVAQQFLSMPPLAFSTQINIVILSLSLEFLVAEYNPPKGFLVFLRKHHSVT
jgi:hypothetical protein